MVDAAARKEVRDARPGAEITLVLQWDVFPAIEGELEGLNRADRRKLLQESLSKAKGPILTELRSQEVAVDDIEGGSEATVTATPETWLAILPRLEESEEVRVLANVEFQSLGE